MSVFWIAGIALFALAIGIVAFPWIFEGRKRQDTLTNTRLIRQRLNELECEEREGLLSHEDRLETEKDLKIALLDEQEQTQQKITSARGVLLIGGILSVVGVAVLYWQVNNVSALENWQDAKAKLPELAERIVTQGDASVTEQDLEKFALGLRTKLIGSDDDAIGWTLLGRVYVAINHIESAMDSFERALAIEPDNIETLASYSQVLLMVNQESYLAQAKMHLNHILELDPQNTGALGMLAMAATQQGDKTLAINTWQRLKAFVPEDAPIYASIEAQIAQLEGNEPAGSELLEQGAPLTDEQDSAAVLVTVNVRLDDSLTDKIPQDGYLFVFAQDANGESRMPAAVVKMPLGDLPVSVELSDRNSVMPTLKLSQLSQVRLVAKISRTGNVMETSGDLQGTLEVTLNEAENTQQTILINEELP
ncbi:MAG: c-type cytochrome biogenesis protein CcmI [Alteromonadaceae bacterium]|uniref:c-type cytochrome biogenesis protein CcmI n=1 Tax=Paraglaciecola chathamensis TaxID=368405 RepID=UPI000C3C82CC|nr:c-type cytochrome biogenesis protein CcmI [Paraglaciecola agarilytica]MBN25750.1 c-type cytochrome biogenesis protein CcmI [Alteromonadaceae bacterium]|tara:strand:+ start:137562 stop:138827 length:1266 start_codon:yes stop_codon:yes gene_type:complete